MLGGTSSARPSESAALPGRSAVSPARRRLELLALILITALAAFLRFWQLNTIPPGFHYDEAFEALEAWRVLTQPGYHPVFFPGNFGIEPLFIYLTALAFKVFGASPLTMRAVAASLGTLTVPALYAAVREMSRLDERLPGATALLAAAVLAILRWHVLFSRVGIEPILVPLLLVLLLWVFWWGLRTNRAVAWILLGLLMGLGPYVYPAARLLPMVIAAIVGAIALTLPSMLRGRRRGLLVAAAIALVVFLPLGREWARNPELLFLRSAQVAATSQSRGNLAGNVLAALAMFSVRGDQDPRNNIPGMPALDILMTIPFCLGIAVALWRWRRPVFSSMLLIGLIMLLPTALSEYAPHFRRAVGAVPAVSMLCGLGLAIMLSERAPGSTPAPVLPGEDAAQRDAPYIPRRLRESGASSEQLAAGMERLRRAGRVTIVSAILLGSAIFSVTAYFARWGQSADLYYAYDQGLWEIGQYVSGLPADEAVLISPRPATDATLAFAWREGRPVQYFDGRHALLIPSSHLEAGKEADYVIIEHEDFRATRLLRELFPDAQEVKTFTDPNGQVYARVLRVQRARGPVSPVRQPQHSVTGSWPGVELAGYDLNEKVYRPGDIVYLQLWWRAGSTIPGDLTVFTHLLGPAKTDGSSLWAGYDARPGDGSLPTTAWSPGDLILDEYQLVLPADTPAGEYVIEVGLYDPASGVTRVEMTKPTGQDHLILGKVRVALPEAAG
jgi:4-amino-4-deoxy-L-arabinose transferase-like glycosyltransferase